MIDPNAPHFPRIVTYRLAYLDQYVDLCELCAEGNDHGCGSLGPVSQGARPGLCQGRAHVDRSESDRRRAVEVQP